ncbi:MAG TPA: SBBP repeat-containing protein [Bryobacteraceae bacterium]|nr:SBBP repeat-containing protein [Bryobacteraceae bacterium]
MSRFKGLLYGVFAIVCLMPVLTGTAFSAPSANISLPVIFEQGVVPGEFVGRAAGRVARISGDEISLNGIALRFLRTQESPWNSRNALPGHSTYLIGPKSQWRTAAQYSSLQRMGIYAGIDVVLHGSSAGMEYDFAVAPGAATRSIRFALDGARAVMIDHDGSLVARNDIGNLRLKAPIAYQNIGGQRRDVPARFVLRNGEAGFALGAYDSKLPVIIDPVLEYMSVLGGSGTDVATAVTTDSAGNVYVAGTTNSTNFPVTSTALESPMGPINQDVFVTKMDPRGVTILYSVYFGGSQSDSPGGIQVDSSGAVYLAGLANSSDFPVTSGAYNPSGATAPECFATKLNATGTAFVYSALLGSCGNGSEQAIAIDSAGDAYITGFAGTGFPTTPGAFTVTASTSTGFALELNPQGTTALYSTFIPGSTPEAIAVDTAGTAYITGVTNPYSSFVTSPGAAQTVYGGGQTDAIVLRLSADGSTLLFSTFLGGSQSDNALAIAVDATGAVYVGGWTSTSGPPGPNPFPITAGAAFRTLLQQSIGFLTKLNPTGTQFVFSTYLGNQSSIGDGSAITVDANGNIYVAGHSEQGSALTENGVGRGAAEPGIDVLKFSADGTMLLESNFVAFSTGANRNGFWFQKKILAPRRVGEPVDTTSLQALYVVGSEDQPGAAISDSGRVFGPGGSTDASIMKVDMSTESSDEFQVDATYLLYNSVLGPDFNFVPSTKTISLTSSGAPLPFHIVTPSTISVSQTDGTTPAQVAVTYTPTQQSTADPLLIITPGAKESYKLLAVANGGGNANWSVPSAVQIQADPTTGLGTATLNASFALNTEFGSAQNNVPFFVQPVGNGSFPSWLQVSPTSGTTPMTITLTGNASGLSGAQSTQIQLAAGPATTTINVYLVPNSAPANLTVTPLSLEFNFPAGATATESQQIIVGSTGVPLLFAFGTPPTGITYTPDSGTTPTTVTVTADPTQLPSGSSNQFGTLSVPGTGTTAVFSLGTEIGSTSIAVSQIFDSNPPNISVGALVNILGAFDTNGQTFTAVDFPWPTTLGGYQVTINGVPLPLASVSSGSIETQMPFDLAPGQVDVAVTDPNGNVLTAMVPVVASKLTAISNPAAAYKLDGSVVSPDNPVAPGDMVVLEFTGQGKIFPPVAPGSIPVPGERAHLGEQISATIGGMPASVQSTAMSATMPGVLVVEVQVPNLHTDDYYAQVTLGIGTSPVIPVSIQK